MHITELHSEAWAQLLARRAQLPHALLFEARRGMGAFELAQAFAGLLLCESPGAGVACGACAACAWLSQGNHPDYRLLQPTAMAESESGAAEDGEGAAGGEGGVGETAGKKKKPSQQVTIDQVRGLDAFLHVGTHRHGVRVIVIHPAEQMNRATANSLLKSLEEPISDTLFILVANESDRLLPTIRSRCQTVRIPVPGCERGESWLRASGLDDAGRWLALAGGALLLVAELADSEERDLLDALVTQLKRGPALDTLAAAAALDRVLKTGKRPATLKRVIEWAQKWLFDLTLAAQGLPPRFFAPQAQLLSRLAGASNAFVLLAFERKTIQYKLQCEQPLNSRLFLEDFFLSYAALFRSS